MPRRSPFSRPSGDDGVAGSGTDSSADLPLLPFFAFSSAACARDARSGNESAPNAAVFNASRREREF